MRIPARLDKPWYAFRPTQVLRRAATARSGVVRVRLPWGAGMLVPAGDAVGDAIVRTGVYDLAVSEALWRLADPGEVALDVGGNLGYMTALLAARVGPRGRVLTFEPNPEVVELLRRNLEGWRGAALELHEVALSSTAGRATLAAGGQAGNLGEASLGEGGAEVVTRTLDDVLGDRSVGVMKLDVEGHELEVLLGGRRTLSEGRVRDVVFEDHEGAGSPVWSLLRDHGYEVAQLERTFRGPLLALTSGSGRQTFDAPSCLASVDPGRARERLSPRGWRVLRGRS
jgi:FkbM family methyltransferase